MSLLILVIVLVFSPLVPLQSKGIAFVNDTVFENVLSLAQRENKMIFIHCYAVWCGPCKMMERNIYPDSAAGVFFNTHFINVKFDMEKPYGLRIRETYGVKGFPTLLFLNFRGELIHRSIGATSNAQELIQKGQVALSGNNTFRSVEEKVKQGDRSAATLLEYLTLNFRSEKTEQLITEHFRLLSDEEKLNQESWQLIRDHLHQVSSEPFQFFLKNRPRYEALYGVKAIEDKLFNTFSVVYRNNPSQYEQLKQIDPKLFERNRFEMAYRGPYGRFIRNSTNEALWKEVVVGAETFITSGYATATQINQIARVMLDNYGLFNDKNALTKAKAWSKQAMGLEPSKPDVYETYAQVLLASGNKKSALKYMQKAIELAKASDKLKAEQYEIHLSKMKGKKEK